MSEAIPFLERPKKLDPKAPGSYNMHHFFLTLQAEEHHHHQIRTNCAYWTSGYAGFDPLGFSDYYDLKWMQEAEIKHGRICMLAAVGHAADWR